MNVEIEKQISAYLSGLCSEEEVRILLAWSAETEENATAFARACLRDELTIWTCGSNKATFIYPSTVVPNEELSGI